MICVSFLKLEFDIYDVQVFLSLVTGADSMARLPPFFELFASARGSAKNIFAVIDRQSKIDSMDEQGKILDSTKINGNIEFKDVSFNYPSRPDVQVNNSINPNNIRRIIRYIYSNSREKKEN